MLPFVRLCCIHVIWKKGCDKLINLYFFLTYVFPRLSSSLPSKSHVYFWNQQGYHRQFFLAFECSCLLLSGAKTKGTEQRFPGANALVRTRHILGYGSPRTDTKCQTLRAALLFLYKLISVCLRSVWLSKWRSSLWAPLLASSRGGNGLQSKEREVQKNLQEVGSKPIMQHGSYGGVWSLA